MRRRVARSVPRVVENEKNKLGSLDHTQGASRVSNVDHKGRRASGLARLTSNFAPGRTTSLDAYGVAIGVFGSGKLASTGGWLRNGGCEADEARVAWW